MALLSQTEQPTVREGERMSISELPVAGIRASVGEQPAPSRSEVERVYRHRLPVRISHWLNVPCLFILIMSGYRSSMRIQHSIGGSVGPRSAVALDPGSENRYRQVSRHDDSPGLYVRCNGSPRIFGRFAPCLPFPAWATIPSAKFLAMGRQWHLFFAWLFVINGLLFTAYALITRHAARDLAPTGKDLRGIGKAVKDHIALRHPTGEEAKRYNVLQKLAYVGVLFVVAPLIILTGLTMSPTLNTAFPWLLTIFGGRQAARTIHFIACFSFVGFIVIHVLQVILTGFFNNIRSMVTGWFVVKHEA